jgi:hypothetical protein
MGGFSIIDSMGAFVLCESRMAGYHAKIKSRGCIINGGFRYVAFVFRGQRHFLFGKKPEKIEVSMLHARHDCIYFPFSVLLVCAVPKTFYHVLSDMATYLLLPNIIDWPLYSIETAQIELLNLDLLVSLLLSKRVLKET